MTIMRLVVFALGAVVLWRPPDGQAADPCPQPAGRLVSIQGQVEVAGGSGQDWRPGQLDAPLCQGDTIRVGKQSRVSVALANDAVLRIGENTTMRLIDIAGKEQGRSWLELVKGVIQSFSRKPRLLTVNSPYLNGSIEGTEFVFRVEGETSTLTVFEGTVVASNPQGQAVAPGGTMVTAAAGQAPQARLVVKPRDAAHWALYYPPVLSLGSRAESESDPLLSRAAELAARGEQVAALALLEGVPAVERSASRELLRAALLLNVGQVDSARNAIDEVLAADPASGLAHALRAVMAVVQNQPDKALADGEKAAAAGDGAAGPIALSYAQQANFRLPAARDTLRAAAARYPGDALMWARLGELELMLGDREQAVAAARRAESLTPGLARSQLVLGFAELGGFRNDEAEAAFRRAIQLESADPLGHLGLGLARIARGELAAGREEIEVAVGLDGSNALLRAYLGKAYFAERRAPLDGQQFAVAKELDPKDPTAYLYDGILKQTENRPVEALEELQQSQANNDNRAVYRGRLLLDQDRAARGTSVAQVYKDLGFDALGIDAASESLVTDPANASAHRFLADSYRDLRRREISRVSELLQSQLLQDVNLNPIQPSAAEANLNLITGGGPSRVGFNEFTALFQRDQANADLSVFGGNRHTQGGEAVAAAQYGRYSLAAGAFGYDTQGWRRNNDLNHQIYNLFAQAALTEQVNVQVELRHRESKEGDLAFNFDPDDFLADKTIRREQDITRLGLRYSPTPGANLLFSYIHVDRKETLDEVETEDPFSFTTRTRQRDESDQYEAQYLQQFEGASLVLGGANISTYRQDRGELLIAAPFLEIPINLRSNTEFHNPRAYGYLNLQPTAAAAWTLGLSSDLYEEGSLEVNSVNPKLGVRWQAAEGLQLRAAAVKVVKSVLANNRTLEPTEVAGFNQFFDDINGTKSWRYAGAVDLQLGRRLFGGIEVSARQLEEPLFDALAGDWLTEDRHEQWHRLYVLWAASERIALRGELVYDRYKNLGSLDPELPEVVETVSLPLGVRYFDPSGYFAGFTLTGVNQRVKRPADSLGASGHDFFTVADAAIGYRFPQRRGMASLGVSNLFDTRFEYQDDSYREFRDEPSTGPHFPQRIVVLRVALSF